MSTDGFLIAPLGPPANGLCSRCGRDVAISEAELDRLVGRIVEAEDGWVTIVCADCAGELLAAPLCRAGRHRECPETSCPCNCHRREGD